MHGPVVRFQRHDERFSHGCTTVLAGDDGSTVPNVLTVHGERKAEIRPGPKIRYAEASAAVSIGPPPVGDGGVPVEAHRLLALSPYPYDEHWVGEKFASENGGVTPLFKLGIDVRRGVALLIYIFARTVPRQNAAELGNPGHAETAGSSSGGAIERSDVERHLTRTQNIKIIY